MEYFLLGTDPLKKVTLTDSGLIMVTNTLPDGWVTHSSGLLVPKDYVETLKN